MRGIRIVYDVHEDWPRQLLSDARIPPRLRPSAAGAARLVESLAGHVFDGIVAAVPAQVERFPTVKVVTVQNFPDLEELTCAGAPAYGARDPLAAHIGGLKRSYGIQQLVDAMARLPRSLGAHLLLAGRFSPPGFEQQVRARRGWQHVQFLGWQSRSGIASLLSRVRIGMAVLHPVPSYLIAYPVKLFEYMAAGIPAIVSDFPLWHEIVGGAGCGLLVDPKDTRAIAEAIAWLLRHPEEAEAMGERGRAMVHQRYNWQLESAKLLDFYERLTR
jgi:glycosyltransferase involved in cell wall biosynthesis